MFFLEIDSSYEDLVGFDYNDSDSELFIIFLLLVVFNCCFVRKMFFYFMRFLLEEYDGFDEKKYYGILMKNIKLWKYF